MCNPAPFDLLIRALSSQAAIYAIGKSGGPGFPAPGDGDVDIYVFCDTVPARQARAALYARHAFTGVRVQVGDDPHWGTVDFVTVAGREVCLLHFAMDAISASVDETLAGNLLERQDNYFYPTGRLATLHGLGILYDEHGFIARLQARLATYPPALAHKLSLYHLDKLDDMEDLRRAAQMGDVPFFHFALDIAMDHLLQALFALNLVYFPSRKRSFRYLDSFAIAPHRCSDRLREILRMGGMQTHLERALDAWQQLAEDAQTLVRSRM